MRFTPLPPKLRRTSCSVLALATVMVVGATPATAQSFLGSGSFTTNGGGVAGIATAPNTTTITVNPGQSVIDWIPTDNAIGGGTINFQNSGTSANFLGTGNYAVLNRINPADSTRSITMNGTIQTLALGAFAGTNGSLYFYTPGGFVLGANSIINVGSLVLSASPITVTAGSFINGAENTVVFGQATQAGAAIVTNATSQINASAGDAYVAMVAPRVQHGGSINVAGSAALVGAEAATINFSPDGLFDIQVTTGTTDANGVASSGTITGNAGGPGDVHRAYMVAVPKNAALTMAITQGGSLGFDVADAADVVGNTVVLSAGYNVTNGSIESASAAAGNGFKANLSVTGANVSSALVAAANGNADISAPIGQYSNFASDVTMRGVDRATVSASGFTTTLNIAGNLDLSTATSGTAQGQDVSSGLVSISAQQGASVTVSGSTNINTNAFGGGSQTAGLAGGDAFGGDISITTLTGGNVTLNGVTATANGYGGYGAALGANGGNGTGGDVVVRAGGVGSSVTVNGNLMINANGWGGAGSGLECFSCDGDGGTGTGGTANLGALNGGTLALLGENISASTSGFGGFAGNGDGGSGFGGLDTAIYADGTGVVTISGATTLTSNATGGNSNGAVGGAATGGDLDVLTPNGGNLTFGNNLTMSANATGGAGATGGGNALGGTPSMAGFGTLQVDGNLTVTADAVGGLLYSTDFNGSSAGNAQGGTVTVYAQNGTLTLLGAVDLSTDATGGVANNFADFAGDGTGGQTRLFANAGGTVDLQSTLNMTAIGSGGGSDYFSSSIGGDGQGGDVRVQATAANASITVAGSATLDASGEGSYGQGGNGTGGTVWADAFGASTATLDFQSNLSMYAEGRGGWSYPGPGGDAQGGQVLLQSTAGSTVTVGGDAVLSSDAFGGYTYDFSDGSGGDAIGGESRIQTYGTTGVGGNITINGSAIVSADGFGGDAYNGFAAQGGDGTGGSAHIITTLGTINILGAAPGSGQFEEVFFPPDGAYVSADGYGGDASGGLGGNGTGGEFAAIEAIDGDIEIAGVARVSASGFGGDGETGGDGVGSGFSGGLGAGDFATLTGGAHIYARNGDIVIGGGAIVSATGVGGNGGYDNGYGGDYGGDGGDGAGGFARILAQNSDLGASSITIVSGALVSSGLAAVNVDGTGGNGGDGSGSNAGGFGGSGGDGTAGFAGIVAAAGNGTVTIDNAIGFARGTGGDGGNGGNGDGLAGGNGGFGGNGVGGVVNIGTASGNTQSATVNDGLGDYGTITIDSSAWGGGGGSGNFGATNGNGGDGGDATGGAAVLLVRGSTVNVASTTLTANATGGNAGFGYVPAVGTPGITGIGGDATVGGDGGIGVIATGRFLIPAQRGTLNAGDISGTAIATPGIGIPDGNSQNLGGSAVTFFNADGSIGSLDFLIGTGTNASNSGVDSISVINGDVVVDGEFSFVTSGNLSLFANNGDMHSGILTLSAGNFVFDPGPGNEPPSDRGTYFADSATITTGNNFVTSADLVIGSSLVIDAPGLINAHNFGIDGDLDLIAQSGGITANNLDVTGAIDLDAFGAINLNIVQAGFFHADAGTTFTSGDITSDSNIQINSGDDVTLGNLVAGITADIDSNKAIRIISGGSVALGDIDAIGGIDITAAEFVDGGNVTTGDVLFTDALGTIQYGNISAGLVNPQLPDGPFSVGLVSGVSINVGTIDAAIGIAFATPGTLTSGNLTTGGDVLGLVDGNISIGDIDADGRVLLADYSMYTDAGGTIPTSDGFDPELVFAAALVPTSGSISLGNILAGSLVVAAGTSINVGSINATGAVTLFTGTSYISGDIVDAGSIYAESGSDIFLGNLTAPGDIELLAVGDISIGNALAGESIDLDAGGYIDGGNMTAGDSVYAGAGSYVDLLNISAGLIDQSSDVEADYNVGILAGTTINTGNIAAFESVGLGAAGNITTGTINAGNIFLALGGGDMSFGTINAGGPVYLADDSMIPLGGDPTEEGDFDPGLILAATPVASGGSIELRGPVNAGNFRAAAGTTLTGLAINSGNQINATSGGNMTLGNLFANNDIRLTSGANIVAGSIDSGDDVALIAAGSISTLDIFAYDDVSADAGTTITTDDITGSTIDLFADGNIDTGNLLTQNFFGGEAQLVPGASITVQAGGNVDTGTIDSIDGVHVSADGSITTGTVNADTFVQLYAGGGIGAGNIFAGTTIDTLSGGSQALANLTAGDWVELDAEGGITFGVVNAESFDFTSGGAVTGGNITAQTYATGEAEGAIVLANITTTQASPIDDFSVGIASATSITVGNVVGVDEVGFATLGNLVTGNITAGNLFMALVGGNMTTGPISTAASGRVYIADSEMFATGGGDDDFDESIVLALAPVATGGSITINGAVTTGRFQAAAGDNLSTRAITANQIDASAGDNATLDGMWRAGQVSLRSGDINITANGGIDAGTNGSILLNAVRTDGGALIGDGLTGTGYALSNAEFGRLSGGDITIAVGGFGGDADTLIGDLTITGPLAGSNIESNDGGVHFITLQEDGAALDGTLRIVGDVVATGFGAENYLAFYTQNFEMDAATGSISITSSGTALAGILELFASRIHIAEGSLLDQLAVNPQFAGYRQALNQQAAVQRPGGIINAANFDIEFGGSDITGPYTLFVQNMGTTTVPAGFLLNAANISDDGEGDLAAGSIDMVINGQIIAEGATLTGIAVRDLLVTEFGTDIFVAGSTINGCPLIGACISAPPPRIDTPVRTDVQLTDGSGLGDGVDGSLLNPPAPLLETVPLGQSGDVNDPVSGAGNPSLYGSPDEDANVEDCDNSKDNKCKTDTKGDGK